MKKVIALILTAAVFASLAAGCAGSASSGATEATKVVPTIEVVEGQPIEQLDNVAVYIPVSGEANALGELPQFTIREGTSVKCRSKEARYGQVTYVLEKTDAASYITYLQTLEDAGWEQYSNNIMEGTNLFATYHKDGASLYCYYISAKNTTYIVSAPDQNLEVLASDNQYESRCTPLLTQVKLLCEDYSGGMGYVIRLGDGRFIVVDGGYNEQDFYHAKKFYALMQEQNVLDKVTIAAWIVTHPHADHLGTAADFLRTYTAEDVDIQHMIFNFPVDEDLAIKEPEALTYDHTSYMPTFMMALEQLWPQLPVTVCHTGQVYHFADATIEILHTVEDFYPDSIRNFSRTAINASSVVFRVDLAGQKIMFLADSSEDCSKDLVKMWGNYLKSDIMQAAHHGLIGGTVSLYSAIDPTVAMVPMHDSTSRLKYTLSFEATAWLWNNGSSNIKEIIVSGFQQRTLELPYVPSEDTEYFSNASIDPWAGMESEYKKP